MHRGYTTWKVKDGLFGIVEVFRHATRPGHTIRPSFDKYKLEGTLDKEGKRRPDFRSSAQKRLMPQLALKLPIFRLWGKRFFVAVDSTFFAELPPMKEQSAGNSEVTWLSYDFKRQPEGNYRM